MITINGNWLNVSLVLSTTDITKLKCLLHTKNEVIFTDHTFSVATFFCFLFFAPTNDNIRISPETNSDAKQLGEWLILNEQLHHVAPNR